MEARGPLYSGTTVEHRARALHADGSERPNADFTWTTQAPGVATVDVFGHATGHAEGSVVVQAEFAGVAGTVEHRVRPFEGGRIGAHWW